MISGSGARGVHWRKRKGEPRAVSRIQGDREKTVFEIKDDLVGSGREGCRHWEARLCGSHRPHGGIDAAQVMEEAPSARLLFDNKNGGVPRGGGRLNVASSKLLLNKGRGGGKLVCSKRPLCHPNRVVRGPRNAKRRARVGGNRGEYR